MLLATRLSNPSWWWCVKRPVSAIAFHLLPKPNLSSSSQPKASPILDDVCEEFLPWLEQKAGVKISSCLVIGNSAYGRSLFAAKPIQTGDCILKVPFEVQITPENLLPEVIALLGDEVGNLAKLAVLLLLEHRLGEDSEWAPYIQCLPRPGELHSTVFWSETELNMIRQSSVYQETINTKCQLNRDFLAVRSALERVPDILACINFEHFMHWYALVGSRAWGSIKGLSLIPFADFSNHDGVSEAIVLSDEYRKLSEVIADRDYGPGEEVLIRYGKFSNATLLLDFGFTLQQNIYDQVTIQMSLPADDPLREMKLDLLQRYAMPTDRDSNCNVLADSFTIKEVKSAAGRGKGLPQSLRAFSRVFSCSYPEELSELAKEAAQSDGRLARRPFKCRSREIQSHQILLSRITHLIEEYKSSIELLFIEGPSPKCGKFVLRNEMARDLLTGELRVLKSASKWLEGYLRSLSMT